MAETQRYDLIAIGGGPAGYVGAIRAAQLGMKVVCVEKDKVGGVCLNWGCIPTKALLAAAEFYEKLQGDAAQWGILADNVRHDWPKVIGRSRGVADNLNRGIHALFKKNKIDHLKGHAQIAAPGSVHVLDSHGAVTQTLEAAHILICTGAVPRALPGIEFDGEKILSSKQAMVLPQQPQKLIIVGAGAIGMEFAYFYHAFGTEVVLIEMLEHLLPNEDEEVSKAIERAWRKRRIETHLGTKTLAVERTGQGVALSVAPAGDESKVQTIEGDKLLIAVGVRGQYEGLFEQSLGVEIDREHIKVDRATCETSVPGIYACGDVIGQPWLAHVASEQAVVCVEKIAGHDPAPIDYDAIPACTYCHPQVASLGLTERACIERGIEYRVSRFPFQASGKAQATGFTEGFVKLITGAAGELIGAHLVGENVTELLAELGLAKRLEATVEEIITTLHAHPTLSEAIHEASLGIENRMIHF